MILAGDSVRVYPHGSPEQAAIGKTLVCSENQRSIMVAFGDKPPFVNIFSGDILAIHPGIGVIFMAYRETVGPWIELTRGGHYEIETAGIAGESIHCIRCGMTSHNPNDVAQLYCGNCHRFHEPTAVSRV